MAFPPPISHVKGADVTFGIQAGPGSTLSSEAAASGLSVFTTRPDTLFGVTHMVVAPEHPLLTQLCSEAQSTAVQQYAQAAARKSDLERTELQKDKSGVFTGAGGSRQLVIWAFRSFLEGHLHHMILFL